MTALGGRLEAGPAAGAGFRLVAVLPTSPVPPEPAGPPVIRVLIAEDQSLVRGALRALLELEEDLEVVAEVGRGDAVVEAAREHRPDVALLDIEMPGGDGIEAARALAARCPAAGRSSSPRSAARGSCAGRWRSARRASW